MVVEEPLEHQGRAVLAGSLIRAHVVERALDKPWDTGSLRAMITLLLEGGRRACEPVDEITS